MLVWIFVPDYTCCLIIGRSVGTFLFRIYVGDILLRFTIPDSEICTTNAEKTITYPIHFHTSARYTSPSGRQFHQFLRSRQHIQKISLGSLALSNKYLASSNTTIAMAFVTSVRTAAWVACTSEFHQIQLIWLLECWKNEWHSSPTRLAPQICLIAWH